MGIHSSHILGIVWINKKNLSKSMSGKDLGIPIYFPWNGEKALTFFQKPTAWEQYGFPQNIPMIWEFVHSQTTAIALAFIKSKSVR